MLYTNASPTSSFTAKTVSLSQTIRDFEYIRVYFKSAVNRDESASTMMSCADFVNTHLETSVRVALAITGQAAATRYIRYETNTSLSFSNAVRITNGATHNDECIPISVSGVK